MTGRIKTTQLKRVFVDKKTDLNLPDPNVLWTPDQVMDFYSNQYPHLVNASVEGPEISSDHITFKFLSTTGTKG